MKPKGYIPKKQYTVICTEADISPEEKQRNRITAGRFLYEIAVKYDMHKQPEKKEPEEMA